MSAKALCLAAALCAVPPAGAMSQETGAGLGVIAGEPTGISAKLWVSSRNAVDAGLAWSFRSPGFFHLHADYLWHFPDAIAAKERIVPYAGIGGRLGIPKSEGILGVRFPVGVAWWPRSIPLDVFLEFAPVLDLVPASELTAHGGVGARYWFP